MVKCPYCGYEAKVENFRLIKPPWKFRFYEVKSLECPRCNGIFNYYSGISPKGRKVEFTIRMKPRATSGVKYGEDKKN